MCMFILELKMSEVFTDGLAQGIFKNVGCIGYLQTVGHRGYLETEGTGVIYRLLGTGKS